MREVCVAPGHRSRAPIRRRARSRSIATPPATWSTAFPYAVAKYRSAAFASALRAAPRRTRVRRRRLRLLPPVVNLPGPAALPGDPLHAQRRGRDLAAARRERGESVARSLLAQQWRRMLRFERRRSPASIWCSPSPTRTARRSPRLYPGALAHDPVARGADRASIPNYFAPVPGAPAAADARTSSSPDRWTGCRTRTACCISCREILPRIRAGRAGGHAQHHRPRADAGRQAARGRRRASRSPAAWTTSGRTSPRARSTSCRCASAAARGSRSSRRWRWARPSSRRPSAPKACR